MTNDTELPASVLERYLVGDASREDRVLVDAWAAEVPARVDALRALAEACDEAPGVLPESAIQHGWERMLERTASYRRPGAGGDAHFTSSRRPRAIEALAAGHNDLQVSCRDAGGPRFAKRIVGGVRGGNRSHSAFMRKGAVASVLAVVLVAVWYWPSLIATRSSQQPDTTATYHTIPGQRATVTLADGSRVTLGPASSLHVSGRTVTLSGEALFVVVDHSAAPFVVKSGNVTTRVLGTAFNVRAYPTDREVRVVVAEGKVAVGDRIATVGDAVTVDSANAISIVHGADVSEALAWTNGRFVVDDKPLRDVIPDLERWYGVQVDVKDNGLLGNRLTLSFASESTNDVAAMLGTLLHASVVQSGNRLLIGNRFR